MFTEEQQEEIRKIAEKYKDYPFDWESPERLEFMRKLINDPDFQKEFREGAMERARPLFDAINKEATENLNEASLNSTVKIVK